MDAGLYIMILAMTLGCGTEDQQSYSEEEINGRHGVVSSVGGGVASRLKTVSIPVDLLYRDASGQRSSDTSFEVSLEDCVTGQTATADATDAVLAVYKSDRGCKAKLTALQFRGRAMVPTGSDPFTTWDAGDVATFDELGEPGVNAVTVEVVSQLGDSVVGDETVVYVFSKVAIVADDIDESMQKAVLAGARFLLVDDAPPPFFTVKSGKFVGFNSTGGGRFTFVLECISDMGDSDTCETVDLADTSYKLVEPAEDAAMTLAAAAALFASGERYVDVLEDRVAPGESETVNGGFRTVTLDGPAQMALHPNLMLIMQAGGKSYQFFDVSIPDLTQ